MMWLRIGTAIALLFAAQACSFGVDLENLYGQAPNIETDGGMQRDAQPPSPRVDASRLDASSDADADADAEVSVPKVCTLTNELSNGDFESGVLAPWLPYSSSSTLSIDSASKRSGNFGLRVVRNGAESIGFKTAPLGLTGLYYARLRLRSSGSISTITFGLGDTGLGLAVVPTFLCSEIKDATMTAGSSTLYVAATLVNSSAASLDVDDVVVYKVPFGGIPTECTCAGAP
jgi:hypothetical protein